MIASVTEVPLVVDDGLDLFLGQHLAEAGHAPAALAVDAVDLALDRALVMKATCSSKPAARPGNCWRTAVRFGPKAPVPSASGSP